MELNEKLRDQVNRSGFPLQIAIEHAISSSGGVNGWQVYSREHSWKNEASGTNGFIDLVLIDQYRTSMMVIECKRVQNSHWIFLNPTNKQNNRRHARTWITLVEGGEAKNFDWADIAIDPSTPESEFCVVAGQDPKSKPMLERVAADLTEATEGFAREDLSVLAAQNGDLRLYYNVIVTTAELKVCDFLPDTISLSKGTIDEANFRTVPYLRFRKQLSVNREVKDVSRYGGSLFREKENTVFIVNSEHVIEFLNEYDVDDSNLRQTIHRMR